MVKPKMALRYFKCVARMDTSTKASKYAVARTPAQKVYIDALENPQKHIVVAHGSAGSGKTKIAIDIGVKHFLQKDIDRIVITRPVVPVGSDIGFLPGNLEQKMKPWLMPVYDALSNHFDSQQLDRLTKTRCLEIAPLTYMRGRTFENCWIVCDEAQNCTPTQLLMILTRIGKNSKLIITGDPEQYDYTNANSINGLSDLIDRLEHDSVGNDGVVSVKFSSSDIERHHIIPYILHLYKNHSI